MSLPKRLWAWASATDSVLSLGSAKPATHTQRRFLFIQFGMALYHHYRTQPIMVDLFDNNGTLKASISMNFGQLPETKEERMAILKAAQKLARMTDDEVALHNQEAFKEFNENFERQNALSSSEPRQPKPPKRGFVYIAFDEPRRVFKIGFTKNPSGREQQLKTANAGVRFLKTWTAFEDDERLIHGELRERGRNITGEWYNLEKTDFEYIINHFNSKCYE